ncbi:ATP-binding protein [Herbaspirillum rubrisubalbicans]|nr:ATP-binding protein [Herbaspirillum rubrisubalbicans]ALU90861.1 two component transmembrane sensor histidine kinase protein [Herbaspirillum rubrisubalbicans M1]
MGHYDALMASECARCCTVDGAPDIQALVKSNARYRHIIGNTPAIIYSSVPSGDFRLTFVSENASRVLGYEPQEMLDDPNFWFNHIHPDDTANIFSSLAMLFVEDQKIYEYRFRTRDGSYLWMHDTLRLIRDASGTPLEVIGLMTDITGRKQLEDALQCQAEEQRALIEQLKMAQAQLLQSEKLASIGQLAAGVAHEINNPIGFVNANLNTLGNYVATLLEGIKLYQCVAGGKLPSSVAQSELQSFEDRADLQFLSEDVTELLSESNEGLQRVKNIVQSLKDFSRTGESNWQMADLHRGLDSTLNIANNELKYKVNIVKQYGELPMVKCLASELNQVFMNLLVNAAQAISERGSVTIRTERHGDRVAVSISDTGHGIAPEHINRIFEPFFTTKPVGSGTGLGLSLSYGIIKKHGGDIHVCSEPGQGTTFRIELPIDPASVQTPVGVMGEPGEAS